MTYYYITEQVFFVIFFARALAQFTTNNLIFHKLCSGDDGNHYLGKICPNELDAQKETTRLNTYLFVTGNLCFVIACTVGGYLSDLHRRRKPLLYLPLLGLFICGVVNIAFVHFWTEVSGTVVAVFNGVMCIFGETNLLYTGGLCYVTDHSPECYRTFRIGVLIAAYYVSTPIGRGLAGIMNVQFGFINCYLICIVLYILSVIIVTFCLKEINDSSYYVDEVEKTKSIKRALNFYDKISVSGSDSEKDSGKIVNSNNVLDKTEQSIGKNIDTNVPIENNGGRTTAILKSANVSGLTDDRKENVAVLPVCAGRESNEAQSVENANTPEPSQEENVKKIEEINEGNVLSNTAIQRVSVVEETFMDMIRKFNSQSRQNFGVENKAFDDTEWKEFPRSKKSSRKDPPYYNAYVAGKRPPLPNQDGKVPKQYPAIFMAFFSLYNSWKVLFRKRTGKRTPILVIMVLTSPLLVAPMIVENSVFPLFVRQKFQWTEPMYGAFAAFKLAVIVVGIGFTIGYLNKVMKVPDATIGAVASFVDTLACFGYILVTQSWQMFLVPMFDIFHGSAQMAVTAVISKHMDEQERGKIFALKNTMDSLIPVLLYPLYNAVYRETVSYFPEAFFLISAACAVPGIFIFTYVQYMQRIRSYTITTKL